MAVKVIGQTALDDLFASVQGDVHTRVITIKGSTALKRGQLIGASGTSGDNGAFASGNTPVGILCEDITPTTAGVKAMVYVSGHFNGNKVTGYTAAVDAELRKLGIFVDKAFTY